MAKEDVAAKGCIGGIILIWLIGILLSLGLTAVTIWGIIVLVHHFAH